MQTAKSSSSGWHFRASSDKDLGRLYEIWHASVVATHDFISEADLNDICVQVKRDYLPGKPVLVAINSDDQIVGFMGMSGHEIESLFIDPKIHGQGLGRAFIEQALARSPYLEVGVNAQNEQAIAFYRAIGFSVYALSPTDDDGRPYPILRMRKQEREARRIA